MGELGAAEGLSVGPGDTVTRLGLVHASERRADTGALSEPVSHDVPLETRFAFEYSFEEEGILTAVGGFDLQS